MTTVLLLLTLPLGLLLLWFDKKNVAEAEYMFEAFTEQLRHDESLSAQEKVARADEMFWHNGFRRVEKSAHHLVVERKHFNMGILVIAFALLNYIGVLLYLGYYFLLQKPKRRTVHFP
jgi:hypothetical protein